MKTGKFDNQILERAAQYVVRMNSDDLSDEEIIEITEWLEQSPEHADAYNIAEQAWEVAGAKPDNVVEFKPKTTITKPANDNNVKVPWASLIAACLLIAVGFPLYNSYNFGTEKIYATHQGERLEVTLKDGSHIHLNENTLLKTKIGAKTRNITLQSGEFAIDVVHNEKAPMKIIAENKAIWDVGTKFNVKLEENGVIVSVKEGKISYSEANAKDYDKANIVNAGYQLRIKANSAEVAKANIAAAYAWENPIPQDTTFKTAQAPKPKEGAPISNAHQFVFDNISLNSAAKQIAATYGVQVSVAPTIAKQPVSAIVKSKNAEDALNEVSKLTQTRVEKQNGKYLIK